VVKGFLKIKNMTKDQPDVEAFGEVVEVWSSDSTDKTVNHEGKPPTLAYYEVSPVNAE
jgi:hypothetical protein